jgi:hypothetical protein
VSAVVANSLLATVNSRQALRGAGVREDSSNTDDTTTSIQMSTPVHTVITGMYVVSDWVSLITYLVDCLFAVLIDWDYG